MDEGQGSVNQRRGIILHFLVGGLHSVVGLGF